MATLEDRASPGPKEGTRLDIETRNKGLKLWQKEP
jgi:hypothetical protein